MSDEIALLPRLFEPLEENQIRILVLYPSKDRNRPLSGRHDVQTLAKKSDASQAPDWKEYFALSYVWGDPTKTGWLTLDTGMLEIRSNVHQALLEIRQDNEEIRLWVDAVCINQGDRQERCLQVSLMGDIYSNARSIAIWLNDDRNILGSTITPPRIPSYHWAYRLWTAYMKLSVLSDIRILYGALEFFCNSRGGFSLLCNGRVIQVKRANLNKGALGRSLLTQPAVTQVAGIQHTLPFKYQIGHHILDDHRSVMQQQYPRRNKVLKSHGKPQHRIVFEEISFSRSRAIKIIPSLSTAIFSSWLKSRVR